jgi:type III secretory pathway component EscV
MSADASIAIRLGASLGPACEEVQKVVPSRLAEFGFGEVEVDRDPAEPVAADDQVSVLVNGSRLRYETGLAPAALAYAEASPLVAFDDQVFCDRLAALANGNPVAAAEFAYVVSERALTAAFVSEPPVTRAAPSAIDVLVEPDYLRRLTISEPDNESFPYLRSQISDELGVDVPPLRLRADSTLKPGGFVFEIGSERSTPAIGLGMESVLVNDTVEQLAVYGVEAQPTINPATRRPGAVAPADRGPQLQEHGFVTWTPLGFIVLSLAAALRRHVTVLVSADATAAMVARVRDQYPDLVAHVERRIESERVAEVLRELLRDRVPVRNLRFVLERLLLHATEHEEDRGVAGAAASVRRELADVISSHAAQGTQTIVAYLVDPALEQEVAAIPSAAAERVGDAVRAELALLPPTAWLPVVLTQEAVRQPLREMLAMEFPQLDVLAFPDITSRFFVQPVARISV